ncbi:MAG TPA: cytochrome c [Solirubrobacteraceae bacterium]
MRPLRRWTLVLVAGLPLAGCGGGATEPSERGARAFASAGCGGCHTLAAARTHGTAGPDLDQLRPDAATVARQVADGGNGMPAFRGRLSAGAIRAVAAYVAAATRRSPVSATAFRPDGTKLADCRRDVTCYRQAFGNLVYAHGPREALARLDAAGRGNSLIQSECHQIAHTIGHAAYARFHGDAAKALSLGSMTCWSGYYHGVIERAFAGVPRGKVPALARRLCTGLAAGASTFVTYQCVHGLGHGLMIYSGNDLPYSLRVCDRLATAYDQRSCTGGVFMQNFLPAPMAGVRTRWLKKDDLLYPCDAVGARDKLYCYLMVTSRILPEVGYDWRRAAAWCRRAEGGWVATCFQSLGRDASGFTHQRARRIVSICRVAGALGDDCIYGAARDVTSNDAGARRAKVLCAAAPARTRARCFEGIGTILGGFRTDRAARRAECDAVTPVRYRSSCYRGAVA